MKFILQKKEPDFSLLWIFLFIFTVIILLGQILNNIVTYIVDDNKHNDDD
jgi:cytoskeletal protein RodZ